MVLDDEQRTDDPTETLVTVKRNCGIQLRISWYSKLLQWPYQLMFTLLYMWHIDKMLTYTEMKTQQASHQQHNVQST